MNIEAPRLLLRPHRRDDLEHLLHDSVRPEYYPYLPVPPAMPQSVAALLERRIAAAARACGMTREPRLRHDKLVRGEWRHSYLYAVLKDEFNAAVDGSASAFSRTVE